MSACAPGPKVRNEHCGGKGIQLTNIRIIAIVSNNLFRFYVNIFVYTEKAFQE